MPTHPLVERVSARLESDPTGEQGGNSWLLAASGGRDSTVLAHLLRQAGIPFALGHMNYRLRPGESDRDEAFVGNLARQLGVLFFVKQVDALAFKGNRQAVCRRLRYEWLRSLCAQHGFRGILTAHHQADQAETVLMALLKGRGMRALAGMDFRVGDLYRPLLDATDDEISQFAQMHGIQWVEDGSNASTRYDRNYVRRVVEPTLTARFPHWQRHVMEQAEQWRLGLKQQAGNARALESEIIVEKRDGFMRWNAGAGMESREVCLELARAYLSGRGSLSRLGELLDGAPHRKLTAGAWLITRTPEGLVWERTENSTADTRPGAANPTPFAMRLDVPGIYLLPDGSSLEYRVWASEREMSTAEIPARSPLIFTHADALCVVRTWQAGDRIRLPGTRGRKKVSDVLNENKVPPVRRRNALVLVQGDEILSVLGHRNVSFAAHPSVFPCLVFRLLNDPEDSRAGADLDG